MITNHPRETPEATACRGRPRGVVAETAVIETVLRLLEEPPRRVKSPHGPTVAWGANALLTAPLTL
ncbi:hypothetical protein [Streptomyces sp. NBC_00316]|uniref:hypothetical protein n=1 Tax=Streptomyces sp. NBC_00316 TaxID=2975710 RepID=UPI002E27B1B8|nr:hypothetical protein [Streptomyces sp. NBC_00316]